MPFYSLFEFIFCNIFKQSSEYVPKALCYSHFPVSILYGITILLLPAHVSLTLPLIMTNFCSYVQNQYSLFQFHLCCILGMLLPLSHLPSLSLLLQHTLLKCPVFPQPTHVFPYARHCLGMCNLPQYQHGCYYNHPTKLEL